MGIFSKKSKPAASAPIAEVCPICAVALIPNSVLTGHMIKHVSQVEDGGWMWECFCGEREGVYTNELGAADTLANHVRGSHKDKFVPPPSDCVTRIDPCRE